MSLGLQPYSHQTFGLVLLFKPYLEVLFQNFPSPELVTSQGSFRMKLNVTDFYVLLWDGNRGQVSNRDKR